MTLSLKLIVPQPMRDNALNVLQTQGFTVSPNGVGLRVAVSPGAKTAPLKALLAEDIDVDNFEIER
jgi:hypothetical protein